MNTAEYQAEAEASIKESRPGDFSYEGEKDLGRTWAMTFSKNRDSRIVEQSNYDAIKGDLEKRFPNDVSDERFRHFAVGWIDWLLVRMLDKRGKVTKAGIAALDWKNRLNDYPIADDEDFTRREFEATLDNIRNEGSLDEQTAQAVYDWLSENDQNSLESVDDQGGYPSKQKIDNALRALGVLAPEEGEDDDEEGEGREETPEKTVYVDPPEQLRLWT